MLFQELDKLKRDVIMTSIILMFLGVMLIILPVGFIPYFSKALGFVLLIALMFSIFSFIGSSKALINYLMLCAGLAAGVAGAALLIFENLLASATTWLVGTVPLIAGAYGIYHAIVFARRSKRKGWFVLVILSALLAAFGSVIFWNPWRGDAGASMKIIGGVLMFSALVSGLSLIWIWPVRRDEEAS